MSALPMNLDFGAVGNELPAKSTPSSQDQELVTAQIESGRLKL